MSIKDFYEKQNPVTGERYDPRLQPRFTEVPTFMRAPQVDDMSGVDIGLIGVPTDLGVTNRAGARHGPREIRNASSMMRSFSIEKNLNPFEKKRIADLGDVPFADWYHLDQHIEAIERFYRQIAAAGVMPLSVGGDHSITYPILKAITDEPLGLIHIDAHTDTWGEIWGSKFHHGAPFRCAVEDGLINPHRAIQIGIRGGQNFTEGLEFSQRSGMRVVFMEEFADLGVAGVIAEARRVVGSGPVYLSFDVDGLDPVYAPGTGTPEVGGISSLEAIRLLRGLDGLQIIAGDVVEVAPPFDQTGNTALVAATLMFEILCLMSFN
ncbi:MAG: agmatinase [Gammaproteobacteria bacterium]|nr:agmatinase [Gammaproteobacteria bacterium]